MPERARAAGRVGKVLAIVLVAASCSSGPSTPPDAQMTGTGGAAVDPLRGTVRLPLDAYLPGRADRVVFSYALDIEASRCAQARGVVYRPIQGARSEIVEGFGVWRLEDARRYGYESRPADAWIQEFDERSARMSVADESVVDECKIRPQMARIKNPVRQRAAMLPFLRELSRVRAIDTRQGQMVLNEWKDCLRTAGISPPGDPENLTEYDWTPPEVPSMSPERRLRTAVADVECKEKVDLVRRLCAIEAGRQRQIMAGREVQLVAYRNLWREHLAAAQKVVDGYQNGE